MRLVAEPHIPLALWLALAVVAIIAWGWYAWHWRPVVSKRTRLGILALMALSLALPLVVLLNLTWLQPVPPPAGKPVIHVLVDRTASMATNDAGSANGSSRFSEATRIANDLTSKLSAEFELRFAAIDRELVGVEPEQLASLTADASETNLAAALESILVQDVPQGQSVVLLSDGIHNASAVSNVLRGAELARTLNVPVYPMTLGGTVGLKNVAVSLRSPQELSFVKQKIPVIAAIETRGMVGQTVRISLCRDEEIIEEKDFVAPPEGYGEVTFELGQDAAGLYRFEVRAIPVADEATVDDNRSTLLLRVVDRPVKVLIVEGKPYWDTKFLIRKLTSDPSIELTSLIRMGESRFLKRVVRSGMNAGSSGVDTTTATTESGTGDQGPGQDGGTSPVSETTTVIRNVDNVLTKESLADLQVLILGRDADVFLNERTIGLIQNWIARDGGSLVCARGSPSSQIDQQLAQILPVKWSPIRETRFRMQLTPLGRDLRWLAGFETGHGDALAGMPSLALSTLPEQRPGLTSILASGTGAGPDSETPVVSFQPYGTGRAVVVEGAGMWRWALLAPEHSDREKVYGTLWRSLMRWLVARAGLLPGQDVAIQPDKTTYGTNEDATATMLLRQEKLTGAPQVFLTDSAGNRQEFTPRPAGQDPGVFRVDFGKLPAGSFRMEAGDESGKVITQAAFDIREPWVERLELDARPDLMQRIAADSGGVVLKSATAEEIGDTFRQHLALSRPPQIRRVTMWDRWYIFLGVLGVWATSWAIRRKSGLI